MTIVKQIDLEKLTLKTGAHPAPNNGLVDACVMEAVAYMAGEPWSDHPACASQVVGAFLRSWNDTLPDDDRQQLKQYVPRLVGSAGTKEQEDARAWMALDWLVREHHARLAAPRRVGRAGRHAGWARRVPGGHGRSVDPPDD